MLSTLVILAQEEAGEGGGNISLVLPETSELIAGIVAFAIVFYFIRRWALPAIDRTLQARQQAIAGRLEEAEKAKREAESLLADYQSQLNQARAKGNELIEEARAAADKMRAEMEARARAEAEQIVAKARVEAAEEKVRALAEARAEVANLSIDLAERVVGANLDRAAQLGLVERYLAELERM
jgi:F-type H+-transporting ATPase subunit b